jgi:hypothetical protein
MFDLSFCVLLSSVDIGLCDAPITRQKESYRITRLNESPVSESAKCMYKDCKILTGHD